MCWILLKKEKIIINFKTENNMKALKITLILALILASITSCTKQDLNEDDVLQSPKVEQVPFLNGSEQD